MRFSERPILELAPSAKTEYLKPIKFQSKAQGFAIQKVLSWYSEYSRVEGKAVWVRKNLPDYKLSDAQTIKAIVAGKVPQGSFPSYW